MRMGIEGEGVYFSSMGDADSKLGPIGNMDSTVGDKQQNCLKTCTVNGCYGKRQLQHHKVFVCMAAGRWLRTLFVREQDGMYSCLFGFCQSKQ